MALFWLRLQDIPIHIPQRFVLPEEINQPTNWSSVIIMAMLAPLAVSWALVSLIVVVLLLFCEREIAVMYSFIGV